MCKTSLILKAELNQKGISVKTVQYEVVKSGVSFGSVLAIVMSWSANNSILWAIIHGFFSWFYVIYYALFK